MKSKKILFLIFVSILLAGNILGCDKKEFNHVNNTPSVKSTPEQRVKPVAKVIIKPSTKPVVKAADDIPAIRATCTLADGTSTLIPVLVSGIKIGNAKITKASKGFSQAQIDKLNYGLAEGRKLYAYWLSTGHDYDIFGNAAKEEVKNGWSNHMVEAADMLRYSGVNTAETKATAREFQFIAQEIVNYQPYKIKAEGYTNWSTWDGSNSYQSVGSTLAMITFDNVEGDVKDKL